MSSQTILQNIMHTDKRTTVGFYFIKAKPKII